MKVNTAYTSNNLMGTLQKTLKDSSTEQSEFQTIFSDKLNKKDQGLSDEEKTNKKETDAFELPVLNPFLFNGSYEKLEEFQGENMDLILNSEQSSEMDLGLDIMENSIGHSQENELNFLKNNSESMIPITSNSIEQEKFLSDSNISNSSINMEELMLRNSLTSIKNPMEGEGEITRNDINLEDVLDKRTLSHLTEQDSLVVKTNDELSTELNKNEVASLSDETKSVTFQTMLNEFEIDSSNVSQTKASTLSNVQGLSDSQLKWENYNQIAHRISGVIQSLNDGEVKQLNLKLYPKTLGEVQVELTLKNGVLTGVFMVDSNEVKQLVEQTLLQNSLNFADDFNLTVDVNSGGSSENLFSFNKERESQENPSQKMFTSTEKNNPRGQQVNTLIHGYRSKNSNIRLVL